MSMEERFRKKFESTDFEYAEHELNAAQSFIESSEIHLEHFREKGNLTQSGPQKFVWSGDVEEGVRFVRDWRKWVLGNRSMLSKSVDAFAKHAPPFDKIHSGSALDSKLYKTESPAHLTSLSARYTEMFRKLQSMDQDVNNIIKAIHATHMQRQPSNVSVISQFADDSGRAALSSTRSVQKSSGGPQCEIKPVESSGGSSSGSKDSDWLDLGRDSSTQEARCIGGVCTLKREPKPQGQKKSSGNGSTQQAQTEPARQASYNRVFSRGAAQKAAAAAPTRAPEKPEQPEKKVGRRGSQASVFGRDKTEQQPSSSGTPQQQIVPRRRRGSLTSLLSQGLKIATGGPASAKKSRNPE